MTRLVSLFVMATMEVMSSMTHPYFHHTHVSYAHPPEDDDLLAKVEKRYRAHTNEAEANNHTMGQLRWFRDKTPSIWALYKRVFHFDIETYLDTGEIDPVLIRIHPSPLDAIDEVYENVELPEVPKAFRRERVGGYEYTLPILHIIASSFKGRRQRALVHLSAAGSGKTFSTMCIPRFVESMNKELSVTGDFRCVLAYVGFGADLQLLETEVEYITQSEGDHRLAIEKVVLSRLLLVLRLVLKFHNRMNEDSRTDAQPQT